MADGNTGTNTMLGVALGAVIVILVGGGILYATGMIGGPKAATVNVSVPAAAPAPQPQANAPERHDGGRHENDRHDGNDRRDDHRPGGDRDRR